MGQDSGYLRLSRAPRRQEGGRRHAHNYYLLGMRRVGAGVTEEARSHFQRALEYDPDFLPALRALADLEFAAGCFREARVCLEHALTIEAPDPDLYFQLGNIALNLGEPMQALDCYHQAERLEGVTPELRFNIGLSYLFMEESAQAEEVFAVLATEQPANARIWDALGCARRQRQNITEAVDAFLKALELDPALNDARDHLAQLLLERHDLHRARQVLEGALALEPNRRSSLHLLGIVFATNRDYAHAARCWQHLVDLGQASPEAFQSLAAAYMRLNDRLHARLILAEMVEHYPGHAQAHLQLGLLLLEEGALDDGRRHLDIAAQLAPNDLTVRQALDTARRLWQ